MAEITAEMVKELRQTTGAGVLECKKALSETDGDLDRAIELLRERGLAKASKKLDRETKDGTIGSYIHPGGRMASLVKLTCETDFVARTPQFQTLARDLAMHVVASRPLYLNREEIPAAVIEHEKEIYRAEMTNSNKPAHVIDKIVDGKLDKWYAEVCLLEQPFVRNPDVTIQSLLTESIATLGENIQVKEFARLEIGG